MRTGLQLSSACRRGATLLRAPANADGSMKPLGSVLALCSVAAAIAAGCGGSIVSSGESSSDAGRDGGDTGSGSSSGSSGFSDAGYDASSAHDTSTGTTDATVGGDAIGPLDANIDVTPPPTGQAGFAFVVNGVVQTPVSCPAYNWEFPPPLVFDGGQNVCGFSPPCPGIESALLINTGQVALAYTAESTWTVGNGAGYPPGVAFGDPDELSGVLDPGDSVDIAPVFLGGLTAVLGSSEPFSNMGHYVSDEGTIPWPADVAGSGGATQMYVAEINVVTACQMPTIVW
jgi:hypothetical protein